MKNNNTQDFALLYKEKCTELADFKIEHQEMIDLSQQIEKELEIAVEDLTIQRERLKDENQKMRMRLTELKSNHNQEVSFLEKKSDRLFEENTRLKEEMRAKNSLITQNEIEIESLESKLRESECIIDELKDKIEEATEKLAMFQTLLEESRADNEEEVQRLKDQLREAQSEVFAIKAKQTMAPNFDYLRTRTMKPESIGSYLNVPGSHYAAYEAEVNNDPLPSKKVKLELGKRSYQRFEESNPFGTEKLGLSVLKGSVRNNKNNKQYVGSFCKDIGQVQNGMFDYLQNKDQMNVENIFQNQLSTLNSMSGGFSEPLSLMNNHFGEFGSHSRRGNNAGPFGNFF